LYRIENRIEATDPTYDLQQLREEVSISNAIHHDTVSELIATTDETITALEERNEAEGQAAEADRLIIELRANTKIEALEKELAAYRHHVLLNIHY